MFFCFEYTATTEIYTYCHTLSLHDALPFCPRPRYRPRAAAHLLDPAGAGGARGGVGGRDRRRAGAVARTRSRPHRDPRSEEHTSELQSLMRISYAVLCLKKQKQKCTTTLAPATTTVLYNNSNPVTN